jgi:rhamnogalacturonan acetylesterase
MISRRLFLCAAAWALFAVRGMSADRTPPPPPESARPTEPVINVQLPTIWVAGDSTAAPGPVTATGWGVPFPGFFDLAKVNVVNRARGGRSTRTFISDGSWDKLLAGVKRGDYVLIQFGHNDAGAINDNSRARGVIRTLGDETEEIDNLLTKQHEVVHSYGWYLRKMVEDVRAKGGRPILLSITVRNEWKDGKVERRNGPWSEFTATTARAVAVPFIDVTTLIANRYEQLGQETVKGFFPKDHTHTSPEGAELNASLVVAGLRGLPGAPVDAFLSAKGRAVPKP